MLTKYGCLLMYWIVGCFSVNTMLWVLAVKYIYIKNSKPTLFFFYINKCMSINLYNIHRYGSLLFLFNITCCIYIYTKEIDEIEAKKINTKK